MLYALMHKNIVVAHIDIDEETGTISNIICVFREEHLPVGVVRTMHHETLVQRKALNAWWVGRAIPASRQDINRALERLELYDTMPLLTHCMGLSLSDHYWIKPVDSVLTWENVNFFDNDFSEDIGNVLFGSPKKEVGFDFHSPDNTSDGNLQKRWKIIEGKRCLIKGSTPPYRQQPLNELIASNIAERLQIPHVPYRVIWDDNKPYSVCEDFITPQTELVSAHRVLQIRPKANHENTYLHFVNVCTEIGVRGITGFLDRMLVLDYIIANEDRHTNNFGLLRNADTLKWIGPAPIFDSGTSLWYETLEQKIPTAEIKCKPFKPTHAEQLRLVTSFDWIDFSRLDGLRSEIIEILANISDETVRDRNNIIANAVCDRITHLQEIALLHAEQDEQNALEYEACDEDNTEDEEFGQGMTML